MSKQAQQIIGYKDGEAVVFEHRSVAASRIGCSVSTIHKMLVQDIEYNGWTLDYKFTEKEIDMIKESDTKPFKFTLRRNGGQLQLTLHFGIELAEPEHRDDLPDGAPEFLQRYKFHQVTLPIGVMDYGSIVSVVFNDVYTNNQFQAIMANHALDPEDEEHETEFRQMQEFRKYAKQYAKDVLAEIEAIDNIDEYIKQQQI